MISSSVYFVALCGLVLTYRYYSAFIAAKVLALSDTEKTPAHCFKDGQNYVPTNRWIVFGHHFAAINGCGATHWTCLGCPVWLFTRFSVVTDWSNVGGAVHDFVVLTASVRHEGKSIAQIAQEQMGSWASRITGLAIIFIIIIALAGLGLAVVNALQESSWGTFTWLAPFQ